jgi:hypothetical protein
MKAAARVRPRTQEFNVADLPVRRVGHYGEIFEELKALAATGQGLMVEFETAGQGVGAVKRMAAMGEEDGWSVYQQRTGKGFARFVWVEKATATAAAKQKRGSDEDECDSEPGISL